MPSLPLLLIVSAPSGAGKTTLCERLLAANPGMIYSVSCTTRSPRPGERDGVHYTFLTEAAFLERVRDGLFLEHARVHGHGYGTLAAPIRAALQGGSDVLMDIDVQGAAQIRAVVAGLPADDVLRLAYADVFIYPPSLEELRRRLTARGKDAPEVVERRLRQAGQEMARGQEYGYTLVNGELDSATSVLAAIVTAERHRTHRAPPGPCGSV
jgi:guanylate kinase